MGNINSSNPLKWIGQKIGSLETSLVNHTQKSVEKNVLLGAVRTEFEKTNLNGKNGSSEAMLTTLLSDSSIPKNKGLFKGCFARIFTQIFSGKKEATSFTSSEEGSSHSKKNSPKSVKFADPISSPIENTFENTHHSSEEEPMPDHEIVTTTTTTTLSATLSTTTSTNATTVSTMTTNTPFEDSETSELQENMQSADRSPSETNAQQVDFQIPLELPVNPKGIPPYAKKTFEHLKKGKSFENLIKSDNSLLTSLKGADVYFQILLKREEGTEGFDHLKNQIAALKDLVECAEQGHDTNTILVGLAEDSISHLLQGGLWSDLVKSNTPSKMEQALPILLNLLAIKEKNGSVDKNASQDLKTQLNKLNDIANMQSMIRSFPPDIMKAFHHFEQGGDFKGLLAQGGNFKGFDERIISGETDKYFETLLKLYKNSIDTNDPIAQGKIEHLEKHLSIIKKDIATITAEINDLEKMVDGYPNNFPTKSERNEFKENLQKRIDFLYASNNNLRSQFPDDSKTYGLLTANRTKLSRLMDPIAKKDIIEDLTKAVEMFDTHQDDYFTLFRSFQTTRNGKGYFITSEKAPITEEYVGKGIGEMRRVIEANKASLQNSEEGATPPSPHKQNITIGLSDLVNKTCVRLDPPSGKAFSAFKKNGTLPSDPNLQEAFIRWKRFSEALPSPGVTADWKCIGEQIEYFAKIADKNNWNSVTESSKPTLESIENSLARITSNYDVDSAGRLLSKQGEIIFQSQEQLLKVIETFHKNLAEHQSDPQDGLVLEFSESDLENFDLHNFKILGVMSEEGTLELVDISQMKKIGLGTYGLVSKVFNLSEGNSAAVKFARTDEDKIGELKVSINDISTEYSILKYIHANGLRRGLQKPPRAFFNISEVNSKDDIKIGHLGVCYELGDLGDFKSQFKLNKEDSKPLFNEGFNDLIYGLVGMHELGLVHGDIKPINLFVNSEEDRVHFDISDMGNVRKVEDITNFQFGKTTLSYCSIADLAEMEKCRDQSDDEGFKDILRARDTYQIGASIFNCLTGKNPYTELGDIDPEKRKKYSPEQQKVIQDNSSRAERFPDHENSSFNEDALRENGCSEEAIDLLKRMCDPDPHQRITADDVKRSIENEGFHWFN